MNNVTFLPWVSPDEMPTTEKFTESAIADVDLSLVTSVSQAESDAVFDALLRRLGQADLTQFEVEEWLRERDIDQDTVTAWLERLDRLGYVDDDRVAQQLVRKLMERKGQGRSAITSELRKRHVNAAAISNALADIDDVVEQARAVDLAVARGRSLQRYDRSTYERRLTGFLMRRGFSSTVVREAVRQAMNEHPPVG